MITIDATKSNLTAQAKDKLTSGSVCVYPVKFRFNSDWDGLTRIAVFRAGSAAVSVLLDETGECTVPWEVLVKPGYILEAGVYGTRGSTVVLPTIWAKLGAIQEGTEPGEAAQEPTPSVYQQLIAQTDEGRRAAETAATQAQADADKAARIAAEMAVLAGQISQDAAAASQAKTDAQTAQSKAETAQSAAETARQAAEDAANSTGGNVAAAAAAATRAESAASQAAAALADLQTLYQQMQTYAVQAVQAIQAEGDTQVERVAAEGAAQVAAAKEQADRAEDAAARSPYSDAETGTWWVWDAQAGAYADSGVSAIGTDGLTPHIGGNGNWYMGEMDTGVAAEGKTAYQYAREGGYTGTEEEFAAKMAEEIPTEPQYELIEDIEITEDNILVVVSSAFSCDKIVVYLDSPAAAAAFSWCAEFYKASGLVGWVWLSNMTNTGERWANAFAKNENGIGIVGGTAPIASKTQAAGAYLSPIYIDGAAPFTKFKVYTSGNTAFPVGTTIQIWGVRANA